MIWLKIHIAGRKRSDVVRGENYAGAESSPRAEQKKDPLIRSDCI